jgi:hypothetical protein
VANSTPSFTGGCHCEALGFAFRTAIPAPRWNIRACQCTFCRSHGALSTSDPSGELEFFVQSPDALQRYRFALRTADFLLCSNCGVYLGAQIETAGGAFGIINTRALRPALADLAESVAADYGAEDSEGRVERRVQRWTPLKKVV